MSIKLITIDGSTQKSGIAYFCNGKYKAHHLLDYSKDKNIDSRFNKMASGIWSLLDIYNPNIIYMEETYTARNPQTTKVLTRLQGVIYAWCMKHECEFNTIRPTQWRKCLNFSQGKNVKRDALKEQSIQYVLDNFGLTVNDDEADAICIADAVIKLFEDKS